MTCPSPRVCRFLGLGCGGGGGGDVLRQEYVISRRFPQKFSKRVLQQYKYHFKKISVLDNYSILESLPTTARTSLLFAQYHDAVDQLSFLQARGCLGSRLRLGR